MNQADPRLPLYQRLRDEIAQQIALNVWRPGDSIPTEAELASEHGIAVGTVRKALDLLVADGLVERRQGRGTFVRRPKFDDSLFRFFRHQSPDGKKIIPKGRILTRESVPATPSVRDALDLNSNERVIHLSRLRLISEKPVLREEIWLPEQRFKPILDVDMSEIGDLLYPAYERLCNEIVARADETVTVSVAGEDDVRLLALSPGEPVVVIDRLALGYDNKPVEWRHTRGSAAEFRYQVEIR
ncbi:transcriptional regulator, GntR family [Methylobacterium sp. 4-46]|uniref:GntR family transcriptional regulator n=1 Tax=unclassified Methylobacterium TaxID=2615210 RepID=UPI000152C847|nr:MULTISPECIES: GntR family transcriptional regulator [Methylobacterium]ACA15327.1 transcriptional regulator, GntR family [Methylobacterium sp. 4-46]WFT81053.1 GntR family transcriptional regulator [Methylobacterium nodulans]